MSLLLYMDFSIGILVETNLCETSSAFMDVLDVSVFLCVCECVCVCLCL